MTSRPAGASLSAQRMVVLTVVDQGASSLISFVLAILVAHYSGAKQLGVFALLTSTFLLGQGAARGMTSDCLLTRSESGEALEVYERSGFTSALVLSCVLAVGVLVVGAAISWSSLPAVAIFAALLPLMAVQDYSRYIGIKRHDPGYAMKLDLSWLALFVVACIALKVTGHMQMAWLFDAWAAGGAAVGLFTLRSHLGRGVLRQTSLWLRSELGVGLRFAAQFMLSSLSLYWIFYMLLLVVSLATVGRIKLALLALAPVTVLSGGVQSALVPLAGNRFRHSRVAAIRLLVVTGAGVVLLTAAWTAAVYAVPSRLATDVFGKTWPSARGLLPLAGAAFALAGLATVASAGLRALRAARVTLWVAAAQLPFVLLFDVGGSALWGAKGFVLGASLAALVQAAMTWLFLVRLKQTDGFADEEPQWSLETEAGVLAGVAVVERV